MMKFCFGPVWPIDRAGSPGCLLSFIHNTSRGAPKDRLLSAACSRTTELRPSVPTTNRLRTRIGPSGVSASTPHTAAVVQQLVNLR